MRGDFLHTILRGGPWAEGFPGDAWSEDDRSSHAQGWALAGSESGGFQGYNVPIGGRRLRRSAPLSAEMLGSSEVCFCYPVIQYVWPQSARARARLPYCSPTLPQAHAGGRSRGHSPVAQVASYASASSEAGSLVKQPSFDRSTARLRRRRQEKILGPLPGGYNFGAGIP